MSKLLPFLLEFELYVILMTYWYVEQGYVVNGFLVICIITNVLYIENVILNEFFLLWNGTLTFLEFMESNIY